MTRAYKVLKIAPTPFFADYGCHVRIYEEMVGLGRLGHQVAICTYRAGSDVPGLDIRRIPPTPLLGDVRIGPARRKPYFDLWLLWTSLRAAWRVRPDVVHAHLHEGALIGWFVAKSRRVPLVFDFQGSMTSEMIDHNFLRRGSLLHRPLRWLERLIDRMPARIITSSRNAAQVLTGEFGVPARKVTTVTDGVNVENFRPQPDGPERAALKRALGIPAARPVVAYLGLLAEYQGIGYLLEAAREMVSGGRDVHFLIMGCPGEDDYRRAAESMGLAGHVTFTGRIPYRDAPRYLAVGDVAVSPKVSETEGNGKLLNYMAMGLPTVTFDTPVARELLGDLGVYAELRNAHSLAERLGALLDDLEEARELGGRLRRRVVKHFDWATGAASIVSLYDELLGRVSRAERVPTPESAPEL